MQITRAVSLGVVLAAASSPVAATTTGLANQQCEAAATGFNSSCTAGDVRVASLTVLGTPVICTPGETINVTVEIKILSSATRYDIGLWLNQDGESARTGTACYRDALLPLGTSTVCNHTGATPTYWNGDADSCGDLYAATTDPCLTRVLEEGSLVTTKAIQIAVDCSDSSADGQVDTGVCTTWRSSTSTTCTSVLSALPDLSSQCDCQVVEIGSLFVATPTQTPSATPTISPTPTPSATATSTPTATATLSPTPTTTSTSTASATATATSTPSGTPTHTSTPTATATTTKSSTPTPSSTPTASTTPTSTPTVQADLVLDADANGSAEALTDGLLFLRYLFGFRGSTLVIGAIGLGADRDTAPEVEAYIASIFASLDVDGNGIIDALTDGLLTLRYLFGFRGATLINGAIGPGATRTTAPAIEAYLDTLL